MKFVIGGTLTILSWDNPVTAYFRKSRKLRHSLGRPSRSDFVHFQFTLGKVFMHVTCKKCILLFLLLWMQISPVIIALIYERKGDCNGLIFIHLFCGNGSRINGFFFYEIWGKEAVAFGKVGFKSRRTYSFSFCDVASECDIWFQI